MDCVGIIGSGPVARGLARQSLKAGYRVFLSNSRGPASHIEVVNKLGDGAQAGTVAGAARADLVILAIPFPKVPELTAVVADWSDEGRQAVFFATEDHAAGTVVGQYVTRLGFAPLSLGGPHDGGRLMQLGGALNAVHVIRQD